MTAYVLDTNCAIAWYLPETFAGPARQWQKKMLRGDIRILVPSLHYWEFGNVLRTYVMRHELTVEDATDIYRLHLDAPLEEYEPARESVLAAALDYGSSVYDAVYICLTLEHDAPLITAEKTTRPWVAKLGKLSRVVSS